jgi:hypothetical protein
MLLLSAHRSFTSKIQDHRLAHTSNIHEYYFNDFRLQRPVYDYLDYLPRLVSTRKLVEDGSRDINN